MEAGKRRHEARCHARLAQLLVSAGKRERAVGHYERALEELGVVSGAVGVSGTLNQQRLVRDRAEVRTQLARALAALKRHRDAIRVYEDILIEDPDDAAALVNLAAQLMVVGGEDRLREAERHCFRALLLRPSLPEAFYNLNVAMRRLGHQREAVDLCWTHLERDHGLRRPLFSDNNNSVAEYGNSLEYGPSTCALPAKDGGVAVLCVKWGSRYGPEYVNKLYRSVMRQCLRPDEAHLHVICLTDDPSGIDLHDNLHCVRLEDGWTGWWNKCQVFAPHVAAKVVALRLRRCVYIDLDTVIVGDVSSLLLSVSVDELMLLKTDGMANERRSHGFNSSVMAWPLEDSPRLAVAVYQPLKEHFDAVSSFVYKFDHWLEMVVPLAPFLQDVLPGQIVEYCSLEETKDGDRSLPGSARVVCFPLRPKPHEANASWIQEFWD